MFAPREPTDAQLIDAEAKARAAGPFEYDGALFKALSPQGAWFIQELAAYMTDRSGLVESREDSEEIERLINERMQSKDIKAFEILAKVLGGAE